MAVAPFQNAFILTGPTGAGKSRLALALAERLGAEIVSMDSMALYRGMDVGTAKPGPDERRRVPHHLIDVLDPWESASVAWWLRRAAECCTEIENRGRRVLFVGGTPLYLKAVLHGLFDGPPADEQLRRRLADEAETLGPAALHARLADVDPVGAARLHPNDVRRVVRALEVWQLTGRPISAWQTQWRAASGGRQPPDLAMNQGADAPRSAGIPRPLPRPAAGRAVRPHRRARPPHDRRRTGRGGPRPPPSAAAAQPGGGAGPRIPRSCSTTSTAVSGWRRPSAAFRRGAATSPSAS